MDMKGLEGYAFIRFVYIEHLDWHVQVGSTGLDVSVQGQINVWRKEQHFGPRWQMCHQIPNRTRYSNQCSSSVISIQNFIKAHSVTV